MTSETMDLTPTPRATALICIEILKNASVNTEGTNKWAANQILKMIIEDWPEDE